MAEERKVLLDQGGYVGGYDSEAYVMFTNGRAVLDPPPDVVYQVAGSTSVFVWPNVFSEIVNGTGSTVSVDYYIDKDGNKVFGTQKGGSFGQPIEPDSGEYHGTIRLKENLNGPYFVNYCVTVPDTTILYQEPYEAWPMWRKLAENEFASAGDAIHWYVDAFKMLKEAEPDNTLWTNAYNRTLDTWKEVCTQESDSDYIFKAGDKGNYNNFPLTFSYAYGRTDVDDPGSQWNAQPPTRHYSAYRGPDGYVTFGMPEANAEPGSGGEVRYGVEFKNDPVYFTYTENTKIRVDMKSTMDMIVSAVIADKDGLESQALLKIGESTTPQDLSMTAFLRFPQVAQDSLGTDIGDWSEPVDPDEPFEPPIYDAVPFPGKRFGAIGDSITFMNTFWNPALGEPTPWPGTNWGTPGGGGQGGDHDGYYEYYGYGMCGYFNYANMLMKQAFIIEPFLQNRQAAEESAGGPVSRYRNGNNWGIAGSKTTNWELAQDNTLGNGIYEVGPMYNARRYANKFDIAVMLGGTNDLANLSITPQTVLNNIRRYAYEFAQQGKWVFILTVMPRTREYLGGWYSPAGGGWSDPETADPNAAWTLDQQNTARQRIVQLNQMLRDWIDEYDPPNIWLVDVYPELVGPNGIDPFGSQSNDSNPMAKATKGNFKSTYPGLVAMYDGLHPGVAGAYVTGKKLAEVMIQAGVPLGNGLPQSPLAYGPNLVANPNFTVTTTRPTDNEGYSNKLGRARGLGTALYDSTHQQWTGTGPIPSTYSYFNNLGLGYQYGQVPDYWQVYRGRNNFPPNDPQDPPEGWSNFNEYTWSALAPMFPELNDYLNDSTWTDGMVTTSIVTRNGVKAFRIAVNLPAGLTKSETLVIRTLVPEGQHGVWDNYGWSVFDWAAWQQTHPGQNPSQRDVTTVPNNLYATGDKLFARATIEMEGVKNLYTARMAINFLTIDAVAVGGGDNSTTGAKISAYDQSQNFWPPSLIDNIGFVDKVGPLSFKTPVVEAPVKEPNENQEYLQFNFEFAFDASDEPATAVIYISNPGVHKITGGNLQ